MFYSTTWFFSKQPIVTHSPSSEMTGQPRYSSWPLRQSSSPTVSTVTWSAVMSRSHWA